MSKLSGKIAVITGGNSGIGLATAKLFSAEGAQVVITGRNTEALAKAKDEIGNGTIAIQSDVSNLADLDRLYTDIKNQHGRIDILFANAGIAPVAQESSKAFAARAHAGAALVIVVHGHRLLLALRVFADGADTTLFLETTVVFIGRQPMFIPKLPGEKLLGIGLVVFGAGVTNRSRR